MINYKCTKDKSEVRNVIDKICAFLTTKIRKEMPEVDDEKAEIIMYGLQVIIGEIPKIFLIFIVAYFLGIMKLTIITFLVIVPYRNFSGGLHMKTHMSCIVYTLSLYCGTALIGKYLVINEIAKYVLGIGIWIFGMVMITLYAPADTENVPILRKKERKQKQIMSYIVLTLEIIIALIINVPSITSIILIGDLMQTMMITRFAYKLTDNKYGHEVYASI